MIIDYGSQYTQLITRRVRESKVYSEIFPYTVKADDIKKFSPKGIILSGGPSSVYSKEAYPLSSDIIDCGLPVLGICYGLQLLVHNLGGTIHSKNRGEYGLAEVTFDVKNNIFDGLMIKSNVWMSHGDEIDELDNKWDVIGKSDNDVIAAVSHKEYPFYGVQFHPEVVHTKQGLDIVENFLFSISNCEPSWTSKNFIASSIEKIKNAVGNDKNVVCGLSGGVDSSVMATLMHRAIGDRSRCIFVDHGLLRKNEATEVMGSLKDGLNLNITKVDAKDKFFEKITLVPRCTSFCLSNMTPSIPVISNIPLPLSILLSVCIIYYSISKKNTVISHLLTVSSIRDLKVT